jgi:hypothetical protein
MDIRICELTHHLVDLFQGKTSGLRHEEVGPEDAASAYSAPDEEYFGAKVAVSWVDHVGNNNAYLRVSAKDVWLHKVELTNDAIPEPVGSSGDSNAFGTNGQLEDLADNDPACRTPSTIKRSVMVTHQAFRELRLRCKEEDE